MADTFNTYAIQEDTPISGSSIGISDTIKTHSNSQYDIATNLIYPSDLQDSVSKKNYIIFHINVNQDSKFYRNSQNLTDIPVRKNTGRFSQNFPQAAEQGLNNLNQFAKSASDYFVRDTGDAMSPMVDYPDRVNKYYEKIDWATNKMKSVVQTTTKPLKRLKSSIMLYMPMQVGAHYGMQYGSENMGIVGSLVDAARNGDTLNAAMNSAGKVLLRIGANVAARGTNDLAGAIGLDTNTTGNFAAAINAATRTTFNPRKEQLFHDVHFRTFTYQFDFAPRTQEECNTVINIINTFKFHMHPEIDNSYFFFMYPSEFDIEYHIFDQGENPYINKISSCALETMDISYGPGSNWATLVNGCPTQIHITLTFIELTPLNKNLIAEGGY